MTVNGWSINFVALITTLLFSSCEKEIEFNGKQTDPKLVINCLVEPNEPVKANISKSYFFLDNNGTTQVPGDVTASLYVNGSLIGEMTPHLDTVWNNGVWYYDEEGNLYHPCHLTTIFSNDYRPQAGDVVKITASANGYDEVEGTTSALPRPIECQMTSEASQWSSWYQHAYNHETQQEEEDSLLKISMNIELTVEVMDPTPHQADCFKIFIPNFIRDEMSENKIYFTFDYDDPIFGASLENDFIDASDLDLRPEGVFTDALFDGRTYTLKLSIYVNMTLDEEYDPEFFQLPIQVEHLSKEYYNYLNTCNQGEVGFQIWAEPIQTYSNVKGGYGVVAGMTSNTQRIALPLEME